MLILASSSPRRRELVTRLRVPFVVHPSRIEERTPWPGEDPATYALHLAREKALDVAREHPDDVVMGADTVVALDGVILGKPADAADARRMLAELRGKTHRVITAVCVRCGDLTECSPVESAVTMRAFSDPEIDRYVATGEPMDKAGAYAVQGLGGALVERVDGCYTNVVGLPLCLTGKLLASCSSRAAPAADAGCEHCMPTSPVL
jgi:septum formation protein